jgi:plastocyanin domain-containing protein
LSIKAGLPTRIHLVTDNTTGCTLEFVIPSLGIQRNLNPTGTDSFEIAAAGPGEIPFTCGMGMYHGVIEVVQ